PGNIDLWMPLATNPLAGTPRFVRFMKVIGRLKPGIAMEQASAEVRTLGEALGKQYPEIDGGLLYSSAPLAEQAVGRVRPAMMLLLGAVGLVLLMACANVANLLLTFAIARGKEIAVRAALGASRFRLLRQFSTESCVLAGLGTVAGVALGIGILRALTAAAPAVLLEGRGISLDLRAMIFTMAVAILSALLAGLPPALRIIRGDVAGGLSDGGRGFTGGHHRFRSGLAVAQISLALALLVGAGLLIRSFVRLLDVNPGFDTAHTATIATLLPPSVTNASQALPLDNALLDRMMRIPGVRAAGAVSRLPLLGSNLGSWIWVEGRDYPKGQQPTVEYRVASPGYFSAMQIPLHAGRYLDEHDIAGAAATVALVNQTAAKSFWPGEDPVGRRIKFGATPEKQNWITVVGVIGDVHHSALDKDVVPEAYRPMAFSALGNPVMVARVDGDAGAILPEMAAAIRAVDPAMPAYDAFPMSAIVARSTAQRRFIMQLLSGFALAALSLAAIGIYGTISQSVAQRTRELGVRIALGASRRDVLRLVLFQGLRLAGLGVLIGGTMAAFLTRLMRTSLFGVAPLDPVVFAAAAAGLALVATCACLAPALRATRVDPLIAMRTD
ncbi:MAG TPA: ADOP family duplicated permease, partial [Candidatus Acidoferrales bacterium]|nr:ADOP family duplicated permease [Candidatus Acidoferrales bacterium]